MLEVVFCGFECGEGGDGVVVILVCLYCWIVGV